MSDYGQTMFSAVQAPWHGKGVVTDGCLTAREAIVTAGLDWLVAKEQVFTQGGLVIPDFYLTRRLDNQAILGIVGNYYEPVQNHELFGFFDPVVGDHEAVYETAGALKGGRVVWLLARLGEEFWVANSDDLVRPYVLLASSHDGSMQITAKPTYVRVVCWNTLTCSLAGSESQIRIKHTENARLELAYAHRVLGLATRYHDRLPEQFRMMAAVQMTRAAVRDMLRKMLPSIPESKGGEPSTITANKRRQILDLYEGSQACNLPGMRGSAWAFYNALTHWNDHVFKSGSKGTDRLHRNWFGAGSRFKQRAFNLVMEFVRGKHD